MTYGHQINPYGPGREDEAEANAMDRMDNDRDYYRDYYREWREPTMSKTLAESFIEETEVECLEVAVLDLARMLERSDTVENAYALQSGAAALDVVIAQKKVLMGAGLTVEHALDALLNIADGIGDPEWLATRLHKYTGDTDHGEPGFRCNTCMNRARAILDEAGFDP